MKDFLLYVTVVGGSFYRMVRADSYELACQKVNAIYAGSVIENATID